MTGLLLKMEGYKKQRRILRGKFTSQVNTLMKELEAQVPDRFAIQSRLEMLQERYAGIKILDEKIMDLFETEDDDCAAEEMDQIDEYKLLFIKTTWQVNRFLSQVFGVNLGIAAQGDVASLYQPKTAERYELSGIRLTGIGGQMSDVTEDLRREDASMNLSHPRSECPVDESIGIGTAEKVLEVIKNKLEEEDQSVGIDTDDKVLEVIKIKLEEDQSIDTDIDEQVIGVVKNKLEDEATANTASAYFAIKRWEIPCWQKLFEELYYEYPRELLRNCLIPHKKKMNTFLVLINCFKKKPHSRKQFSIDIYVFVFTIKGNLSKKCLSHRLSHVSPFIDNDGVIRLEKLIEFWTDATSNFIPVRWLSPQKKMK